MLGADKVSDKMLMWCLNTQFNVFGVFRVAVEQLGLLITQLIFCSTTQTRFVYFFLNHGVNLARAREMKHPPARKTTLISIDRVRGSDGATKAEWPGWKTKP